MSTGFFARDDAGTDQQQETAQQAATAQGEAANNMRGWFGVVAVVGAVVAWVPPVAVLGAAMFVVGGLVWLLAPATVPAQTAMVEECKEGGGFGAALLAVTLAVIVMALAGLAGAGVALFGGGL